MHSDIRGGGVTRSIREVAAEKADIGGSCRRHMWGEGHERGVTMIPFAWDGLAVIVNKTNPAKKIRIDDLRKVCLGEITNCKELGGADQPVKLFVREGRSSGVGSSTRKLLFGRYDQQSTATRVFPSTGPLEQEIAAAADVSGRNPLYFACFYTQSLGFRNTS